MTKQLSAQDLEILSAYLDGELTSQEQTRLEQSLGPRSDLRQALDELRRTRIILRSAARLRAPRNFVLTPDMVGRVKPAGKPFFAFNALRFSSVLATILLLVSVVGEWLAFSGPAAAPVAMMNEPSSEAISLPPEAALLPAATLESSELSRSAPQQPSAKAPDAPQGTPTPTGEVSLFAAPAMETTPDLSSTLDGSGMGSAMVAETPTLEATPMIKSPAEAPSAAAYSAEETPELAFEQSADTLAPSPESPDDAGEMLAMEQASSEPESVSHLGWRFIQAVLIIIALITAAGALLLQRIKPKRKP